MTSPRLEKLEKLLAADPTDAFVLYGLAQEHAKLRDYTRAVEFYDRCLAADAHYCYAYYHKAVALQAMGRVEDARGALAAGITAAKAAGDQKALGELGTMLDAL